MRKNGSKFKLKNLAEKILNVIPHPLRERYKMDHMIHLKIA